MDALKHVIKSRRMKLAGLEDPEEALETSELAPEGSGELEGDIDPNSEGIVAEEAMTEVPLEAPLEDQMSEEGLDEALFDESLLGKPSLGGKVAALIKGKNRTKPL